MFLVSAEYEWATTYIINRVTNGDYGVAIAYCSVLIVLMLAVIWIIQRLVGERTARPPRGRDRRRHGQLAWHSRIAAEQNRRCAGDETSRPMKAAAIEFRRVSKRYGEVAAVRDISFTIAAGTLVTLLGPSGCGKTTTLRMIAGLELPSTGSHPDRRRRTSPAFRRPSATYRWCSRATRCSRT